MDLTPKVNSPDPVVVLVVQGEEAVEHKVNLAASVLARHHFAEAEQLADLYEDFPSYFSEVYQSSDSRPVCSFLPGVSELLDRICSAGPRMGSREEVHQAVRELVALLQHRYIGRYAN